MGSGDPLASPEVAEQAGREVAKAGFHLLTGGGGGVMEAASRGFASVRGKKGLAVGVLPATELGGGQSPPGYPNPWVELPIRTHLIPGADPRNPGSRNPVNILTADALLFLPGSVGTAAELVLARKFEKPRLLILAPGEAIGDQSAEELAGLGENVAPTIGALPSFLAEVKIRD